MGAQRADAVERAGDVSERAGGRAARCVEAPAYANEGVEALRVLQLGVAVEQQRGVVGVGNALLVECLKVRRQVADPLGIEELARTLFEQQWKAKAAWVSQRVGCAGEVGPARQPCGSRKTAPTGRLS